MTQRTSAKMIAITALISLMAGGVGGAMASMAFFSFGIKQEMSLSAQGSQLNASAPTAQTTREDDEVIAVVKKASPAVVSINITKEVALRQRMYIDPFDDLFLDPFSETPPRQRQRIDQAEPKQTLKIGGGSGFFISSDGLIATNKHVVTEEEAEYTVTTADGKDLKAKVVAVDPVLDLAMIKVEGTGFPFLELGNSDDMQVGQTTIAIGYALAEFENTVTKGVISGINRRVVAGSMTGPEVIEAALQTDAAINPGNSGGPLLNLDGKVIGVNTAISENAQSLGFAIPSNLLKNAVESVKKHGRIVRPWIGVRFIMIDEELAKKNNLDVKSGALIARGDTREDLAVMPGSPADKAGLRENDIIVSMNGSVIDDRNSLSTILQRYAPGDKITLKILRQGKEQEISLTLEERK